MLQIMSTITEGDLYMLQDFAPTYFGPFRRVNEHLRLDGKGQRSAVRKLSEGVTTTLAFV